MAPRSGVARKAAPAIGFARDTEEGIEFLRVRLVLWQAVLGTLSAAYGLACNVVGVVALGRSWSDQLAHPGNGWHLLQVALAFATCLVCHFTRPSRRQLELLDAISTVGVCTSMAVISYLSPAAAHPGLDVGAPLGPGAPVGTFGNLGVLAVRAALVPSTPRRTLVLSVASSLPLVAAGFLIGRAQPTPTGISFAAGTALLSGLILATPAIVSWVVYELQEQVREARQLGQYTLESKIGEGGMGVVYRARHALLRRPTAIKLLPLERAGAQNLARFEREVQQTSRLNHPNTVAIYDFGHTAEGVFYYAMEMLDGLSLEELVVHDGPQPPGRVVHLLRQACGALAEAHEGGLIHRDVKPANLHLCRRGRVDFLKVLDFGLVKEIAAGPGQRDLSMGASLIGTPLYMAPEAIARPDQIDGRADLYGLAAVAYVLLTGTPPFQAGSTLEVCNKHLHAVPDPPSRRLGRPLPAALEALVLRCLAKDPDQRPVSAHELERALAECPDVEPWTREAAAAWWDGRARTILERLGPLRRMDTTAQRTMAIEVQRTR